MRRVGHLWESVVSFRALMSACERAALGKRERASVARFLVRREIEVLKLERELREDAWLPGAVERFEIRDPKRRTITAIPFRDRVVHHALIAALEPVFERRMIHDSYACRRGKGTHAALRRAQRFARRHDCFLKLDVRSFFPSVRHEEVAATLARLVKDRRLLALCDRILRGPPGEPATGKGLPIGSLTSQWFANILLDRLDHHVKERLRIRGYVRYMDDFVLFANAKPFLAAAREEVRRFLGESLRLRLKERATVLAPVHEGLPFLGWRVFRGTVRLAGPNRRRHLWRLRQRRWQFERGELAEDRYRAAVASVFAHLSHGATRRLSREWCQRHELDL